MTQQNLPVFVYGSLRRGEGNYRLLAGRTVKEVTATIDNAIMHDYHGGFPFVRQSEEFTGTVVGEVMYLSDDETERAATMRDLDRLEGYVPGRSHNLYERLVVTVTTTDGEKVDAYMYQPSAESYRVRVANLPVVESGDWVAFVNALPATSGWR